LGSSDPPTSASGVAWAAGIWDGLCPTFADTFLFCLTGLNIKVSVDVIARQETQTQVFLVAMAECHLDSKELSKERKNKNIKWILKQYLAYAPMFSDGNIVEWVKTGTTLMPN
jgi:hypothetical protein